MQMCADGDISVNGSALLKVEANLNQDSEEHSDEAYLHKYYFLAWFNTSKTSRKQRC